MRVAAFYRFVPFAAAELPGWRERLLAFGTEAGLRGTVLLATEGLNGTVCGPPAGVEALLGQLRADPRLAELDVKGSTVEQQIFHRFKVRLKREIVTMGLPGVDPRAGSGVPVPAGHWNALIADSGTLVIDVRNAYEVALGSFEGAIDPATASFRDFPAWVEQRLPDLVAERRPRRLALFCTGGIRCEKASAHLLAEGYGGVHQLQGGILRYLEQVPRADSRWRGECYVFDQRVALDHRLAPGEHSLCHACGLPLTPADRSLPSHVEGVSCRHCIGRYDAADRARFAERQRQMALAAVRGDAHIGRAMPSAVS